MLDKFEDACGVDANCEGPAHAFPPSKYPFRLEGCHLPSFSLPLTNIPPLSLFDLPSSIAGLSTCASSSISSSSLYVARSPSHSLVLD